MSADNWTVCPNCQHRRMGELEASKAIVAKAYGQVPVEEFDELRAAAEKLEDEYSDPEEKNEFCTFREDYEFWGAPEGVLRIVYKGGCTACGTNFQVREERTFWEPPK